MAYETATVGKSKLTQEACKWIAEAAEDRETQKPWHRDFYRYFKPWARRPDAWKQENDQDDLFDSTAIEALSDFSADMQTTFTPPEDDWLDCEPAGTLVNYTAAQLAKPLKDFQTSVFSEVRRSNFHEASLEAYSDLGGGTMAAIIQDIDINSPIQCQSVPITDLLICRGVHGGLDFRCRVVKVKARDLKPTYPKAKLTAEIQRKVEKNPNNLVCVHECVWRLWDTPGIERWQFVLLIEKQEAQADIFEGAGSCPIIVARWRTDATTAWGFGAAYVVLPTVKTLDQLNYLTLEQANMAIHPPGFYDDDGTTNLDNGLTPGDMVPRAIGSKIEPYVSGANFDIAFYERDAMQSEIKRALFQDKPRQSGDTPPTAVQWMDQKAEIARRMGAPFGRLTTEWQIAVFERFSYLLAKRGTLQNVKLNGDVIHLRAQSPIIKAQRQQKAVISERLLGAIQQFFGPELVPLIVDMIETSHNLKQALGDDLVKLRTDAEISEFVMKAAAMAQQAGLIPAAEGQAPPQQAAA